MLKKWLKKRRKASNDAGSSHSIAVKEKTPPTVQHKSASHTTGLINRKGKSKTKAVGGTRKSSYKKIERDDSRLSDSHALENPIVEKKEKALSVARVEQVLLPLASCISKERKHMEKISIAASDSNEEGKREIPLARIRPIRGPPERSSTNKGNPSPPKEEKEMLTPTPVDKLARDLSFLDVSINTALFAHEEGKEKSHQGDFESGVSSPPTIIQTVLPKKPSDIGGARPSKDGDFFTATRSVSGTGSKRLQMWLDEVIRSIDAQRNKNMTDFDRYHVQGGEVEEEKSEKSATVGMDHREELAESQKRIEDTLRDTIQRSKQHMTTTPRGILKSKNIESGSIKESKVNHQGVGGLYNQSAWAQREMPIKVFSKSQRQRLRDGDTTEDETTSFESQTSSGSDDAYKTLHRLHPSVSRDETHKSHNSMQFFFNGICDIGIGDLVEAYEEELCRMDDSISIDDDTLTSQSTKTKDSYMAHGGWNCFDAF